MKALWICGVLIGAAYLVGDSLLITPAAAEDLLAAAEERYIAEMERIERIVIDEFAERITEAADTGDIEEVTELQGQQRTFEREGYIVEDYHLRSFRARIRSEVSKAYRDLDDAYSEAIAQFTRERKFDRARAVLELRTAHREKGRLEARDGILILPRSHRREPPEGNQEPEGDMENGPPGAADPPSREEESGLSPKYLTTLNSGDEREQIGDRLLPVRERQAALKALIFRMRRQYSPTFWTKDECRHFASFVRTSVGRFNENCNMWWPSQFEVVEGVIVPAGEINTGGSPEDMAEVGYAQTFRTWICTAPSVEIFIERAKLSEEEACFSGTNRDQINGVIKPSDLKHWFRCVGIDDLGEARAAAKAWIDADLKLSACKQIAEEVGIE